MTTQSPDGIAKNIVNICGVPNGNDRNNLIYSISQAISQERASKPTLVLPDEIPEDAMHTRGFINGWNRCLEELARLNAPAVCDGKCEE